MQVPLDAGEPAEPAALAQPVAGLTQAGWSSPATTSHPATLPAGFTMTPKEHVRKSRRWLERRYGNIVYFNELPAGGHFTALEQPGGFAGDVRATFRLLR